LGVQTELGRLRDCWWQRSGFTTVPSSRLRADDLGGFAGKSWSISLPNAAGDAQEHPIDDPIRAAEWMAAQGRLPPLLCHVYLWAEHSLDRHGEPILMPLMRRAVALRGLFRRPGYFRELLQWLEARELLEFCPAAWAASFAVAALPSEGAWVSTSLWEVEAWKCDLELQIGGFYSESEAERFGWHRWSLWRIEDRLLFVAPNRAPLSLTDAHVRVLELRDTWRARAWVDPATDYVAAHVTKGDYHRFPRRFVFLTDGEVPVGTPFDGDSERAHGANHG
jgi:hypothetical protein